MLSQFDSNKPQPRPNLSTEVTIQGLRPITDARSGISRRFFWLVILCGGLAFTGYNISQQILHYLATPINVHVDVKLAQTLRFPAVTICSTSVLKKSASDYFNTTESLYSVFHYDFLDSLTSNQSGGDFSALDGKQLTELLQHFGFGINDSVLRCEWDGLDCETADLQPVSTDLGRCFTFNGDGHLKSQSAGRQNGLRLHLNALSEEFTRSRDHTEGVGFVIAVHSPDVPVIMADIGMALSPGSQYFFGLDSLNMTSPNGLDNCGTKSLRYYQTPYSREACRVECSTDYIVEKCSCRDDYMPGNATTCTPSQGAFCVVPAFREYVKNKADCDSKCPQSCSYVSYGIKTQSSLVLTDEYLATFASVTNKTFEYWKENFVSVEVYFTSMSYTYISKRYGYSFLDLLCDIGGALGLCLGASLVTGLELVDFMFRTIYVCWGFKETTKRVDIKPR